ncbi:MAG TPA: histidine kinase dimerization/phosphoacceptor domain -containing protein [Chitinophagaceae bacterium]|nr:histidine kinase dimerization/phosphoacceptor domain -containing protein [Chitinophagaceae bacterium]
MLKVFIAILIGLHPAQLVMAQDGPTHSIAELQTLLKKATVDSDRVNLLLEASLVYIWKPGMEKNDFDRAIFFANQAMSTPLTRNEPVWQARCFVVYSQLYREGNQKEKGKLYIDSAIGIFTKYNVKNDLAGAYWELGNYYDIYSDSEWTYKIKYAEETERLYKESGEKLKQAHVLKDLGDFYQVRKFDSIALKQLYEALSIYKSLHYEKVQGVYDLIGYVYHRTDYQNALKYGLLAVETAERLKTDVQELSTIYNRVGLTYYRLVQYHEALNYFKRAYTIALNNKDTTNARQIATNIIDSWWRLGDQHEMLTFLQSVGFMSEKKDLHFKEYYFGSYVKAYLLTGNYKKAEPYIKELHRLVNDSSAINYRHILYRSVIPYYFAAGQYKEMYKYLPRFADICKQYKNIQGLTDGYLWWYKADSSLGNHPDAITHYKLYKEASDSSLRFTARQQVNQLMIQHEAYKKDQELAFKESNIVLLNKEAKMQQQQLRQTRLVRNLTYGLSTLLLLMAGLLFNRYRLKQRSNMKLEQQQKEINDKNVALEKVVNQKEKLLVEKEWLLKEVHHRVKNNFHVVASLLEIQSSYLKNKEALTAIKDSQHRIHSMSIVHQKLYLSETLSSIHMPEYIYELVEYLRESYSIRDNIRFSLHIENIELNHGSAITLGLILNEAITNAIKYAFAKNEDGGISISLTRISDSQLLLSIDDNGSGLPVDFESKLEASMGMELLRGLTDDLGGSFSIETKEGTHIKVFFDYKPVTTAQLSFS